MNWPINEWNSFINIKRNGKKSKIVKIDLYNECMIIYLDKDDPIILPCWDGTPKDLASFPNVNDTIIVEGIGENVPITYNLTANAYLLSDYSDKIIGIEQEIIGQIIDLIGLRKKLAIEMEPNLVLKIVKQVGDWVAFILLGKIKSLLKTPKLILLHTKWIKTMISRSSGGIKANITGKILFIKKFGFKTVGSDNIDYFHNYVFARIYSNELKSKISILYYNSQRSFKIIYPPLNETVEVFGKFNIKEGTFFATDIKYNGKSIFSKGCFIASEVYGFDSEEVKFLKKWRDDFLDKRAIGRIFINVYYLLSPNILKLIQNRECIKKIFKMLLNGLIKILKLGVNQK